MKTNRHLYTIFCMFLATTFAAGASCSPTEPNPTSTCGDGITEGDEQCDNGVAMNSDTVPNACRTDCVWYSCGDGVQDVDEECDDGNNQNGDGCSDTCMHLLMCGDGIVEGGEQCDDGNNTSGDGCSAGCVLEWVCGDGVCETARQENCPACPEDCCPCGDGTCDQAMGETCSLCQDDCCPDCGDSILDSSEQCDDGNNTDNDGCSAGCIDEDGVATCGNSIWEAGEGCEDGNTTAGDGCSDTCQLEYVCGDGTCEDTFGETCQICPGDCCPACGNNILEPPQGEVCDSSQLGGETCEAYCYSGGTPTCTAWCELDFSTCTGTLPVCGNATAECGEDCDGADWGGNTCESLGHDGGTLGCSSACEWDLSNCGPPILSCAAILNAAPGTPSGVFTIDADTTGPEPSFDAYCDMTTDGGGWTLIAAFSNSDGVAHWVQTNPWWYATTAAGDYTNPATTADAISPAFYTLAAQEFMVMDSVSGTAFRRSIGNCLGDTSMGAMLTALNFVPATSGLNACLKQCDMQGTGTLATTWYSMTASDRARFGCNDGTDTAGMITFHTDTSYYYDTMTQCSEADWGLGSMEYPPWGNSSSSDVGTGGSTTTETVYMYVR